MSFPVSPLSLPMLPPLGGALAGVVTAVVFVAMPASVLEDWVWASGLPAVFAVASPPLGITARAVLALAGGAMTASVVWSLLYLLFGPGGLLAPRTPANAVPVVRRADAHRDAPPRRPMTAADLGTPLMEVGLMEVGRTDTAPPPPPVEQPLPKDLEQPLAAFHPGAIPDVPLTPPAPVAPLARTPIIAAVVPPAPTLARGERIETYVLTPPAPTAPPEAREPIGKPSIDALLRRLEEVTAQRVALSR